MRRGRRGLERIKISNPWHYAWKYLPDEKKECACGVMYVRVHMDQDGCRGCYENEVAANIPVDSVLSTSLEEVVSIACNLATLGYK